MELRALEESKSHNMVDSSAGFYNENKRLENISTEIFENSIEASQEVAREISDLIRSKADNNEKCVLGLATGSTPTTVYSELVRMHQKEGLSFKNVVTFNLDEYYPMNPDTLQSYVRFMNEHLFDHVDIAGENIHIPDGTLAVSGVPEYCMQYEKKIEELGGIDYQILGIGRTGHIGFNEPGSHISSPTRMITLDHITRLDAASDFFSQENVPKKAITMGVGTILKSHKVVLMAWGEGKAHVIAETIEGEVRDTVPATYLQMHPNAQIILDQAASAELTRIKSPWLVSSCEWTEELMKKATIWLCEKVKKPILKLTNEDYNENGMSDLVTKYGSSYEINLQIFNELQHTITGWPGGKPNAEDTHRPERAYPSKKRVVIFSPHPDDDVISMGGTFGRLVEQGHEVHVAYQTSGNIAVFDEDVIRFADFFKDLGEEHGISGDNRSLFDEVVEAIESKPAGEIDRPLVRKIKGLIRKGEAKAGCRYVGISDDNAHFLDMPFYETGLVKKKPISNEDINIIVDLLEEIKPHQIYAAGDLSDPHGTHRVCLDSIYEAINRIKSKGSTWLKECYVWLYRGAWHEWDIHEIEMAVPLSPDEVLKKRRAIFKHQSQKDSAVFPGNDMREFWQRAEDRNRETAEAYDRLGLAEYEAMEAFRRYRF